MRILMFLLIGGIPLGAQTLATKLGFESDAKLLIVHADDLGSAHSVNVASIDGLERGSISSASVMVPCSWTKEVAEYAKANPDHDLGIHLTVTCEWENYKWGPVASRMEVSSLVDTFGFFYSDCVEFGADVDIQEVEIELRAQIDQAIAMGLHPTHLDSHMGCLFWTNPEIFKLYVELARAYGIPCLIEKQFGALYPEEFKQIIEPTDIVVDAVYSPGPEDYAAGMDQYYAKTIRALQPGLNMIIIHAGLDNEELQAVTIDHPDWGAAWRQADYDFFVSEACAKLLQEEDIKLITWREVARASK